MSSGTILEGKQNFPKEAHVFPLYNLSIVWHGAFLLNCIHIIIVEGDLLHSFYREIVFIISHPIIQLIHALFWVTSLLLAPFLVPMSAIIYLLSIYLHMLLSASLFISNTLFLTHNFNADCVLFLQ